MTLKQKIQKIRSEPSVILSFFEGTGRLRLYNSRFRFLIPKYIQEQFIYRTKVMDQDCYFNASCKMCGCETPALQMATKPCEGNCYPRMMSKKDWKKFKTQNNVQEVSN